MSKLLKWIDENQFKDTLPIFYKLVRLLSTNPATSCTAERPFSTFKRTLTWLRSTMNQERLRDVAIIAMERDITINILENKLDEIVDALEKQEIAETFSFN